LWFKILFSFVCIARFIPKIFALSVAISS